MKDGTRLLKLLPLGQTELARQFEHPVTRVRQWVPRRVFTVRTEADVCEVEIQSWWLKANPFTRPEPVGQKEFGL